MHSEIKQISNCANIVSSQDFCRREKKYKYKFKEFKMHGMLNLNWNYQ